MGVLGDDDMFTSNIKNQLKGLLRLLVKGKSADRFVVIWATSCTTDQIKPYKTPPHHAAVVGNLRIWRSTGKGNAKQNNKKTA